ncbi:MAG: efflux RND transporter periplasmic adaptor subunit [Planctomycetota bacterium]
MTSTPDTLAERLSGILVTVRSELSISRHTFRDGPAYVVRDPITFNTVKLDPPDYHVMARIRPDKTLGEIFTSMVADDVLTQDDEESFYLFVLSLHRDGLLSLPVNDPEALYQRFERQRAAKIKSLAMGFMFMRVPLINPDRFLDRTVQFAKPFFTRWAFIAWLMLMVSALGLAISRWADLSSPLLTMLTGDRLIVLWFTLIGLKVVHEFGHAYACKVFDGHVPEMGAFFILFTPCAYVDATDSWSFTSRLRRIIVALGGVYFESIIGALALFVWAFTGPSLLNTIAYQTVLLSTVVTLAFNLNPLMRYDGYYIVSDLVGIPNMRERANSQIRTLLKRWVLGLKPPAIGTLRSRLMLSGYGVGLMLYRVVLVLGICTVIATKFYLIGLALAVFFLVTSFGGGLVKLFAYLFFGEETKAVRRRAAIVGAALALGVPTALAMAPYARAIDTWGALGREHETILRAGAAGFVRDVPVNVGDNIAPGSRIASLDNPDLENALEAARMEQATAELELRQTSMQDRAVSTTALAAREQARARVGQLQHDVDAMTVRAPHVGEVVSVEASAEGMYVNVGDPIAEISGGTWQAEFFLAENEVSEAGLSIGETARCRLVADTSRTLDGIVTIIEPTASRDGIEPSLTSNGGGAILVDPASGRAATPFVRIVVAFDTFEGLEHDASVRWRIRGEPRPLGAHIARRVALFLNKLKMEQS